MSEQLDDPHAPPDLPTDAPPRLLGGRYLLEEPIARGGMAEVWRAHDEKLARTVAVKVLHRHLSDAGDYRERFRREAVSTAKLSDPGIVGVYDTGTDSGWIYLVMEYIAGPTLAEVMQQRGPLEIGEAARIGQQVATALHAANRHGLVHRDIKPANVLIDASGLAKVTDFGIVKAADATSDLTQKGMVLGTAAYLAPEQIRGQPLDHRADQYALGCVLFEALTGHKPFSADTSMETAAQRLKVDPPDIRALRGDVPRELARTVMRALSRDPDARWPDNAAFAAALAPFAATALDATSEAADQHSFADSPAESGEHSFFRSEWRWLTTALVVLGAVGLLVGVGLGTGVLDADGVPSLPAFEILPDDAQEQAAADLSAPPAAALSVLDPAGDGENNDQLPRMVDDDPATAWSTETYRNRPDFGGLKDGVGVVVDLGEQTTVTGVRLQTPTPGITVQLLAADERVDELSGWTPLSDFSQIADDVTVDIEETGTRYLMLWITGDLVEVRDNRWQAAISELAVRGEPA